ncbi:MAG: PssD/Cps14F family polysaccharide biosynthesis glycosyltransferase [Bacteroidales bacterium]|jgi:UDP-N-acetylglucosamine:LPS N-acetylglucosamine transferase|nr:PssD/Cps14F family polysaccharide biosynthesis glycosyltransferase [Bacteroidales bacterium]
MDKERKRVLFVSSSGGHLTQLLELAPLFEECDYLLVTEKIEATQSLKKKYNTKYARPAGKGRNFTFWFNFLLNHFVAFKIILSFKPTIIITTGAHTAVPFCLVGKLLRKKIVYILTFAKIKSKAKSANIVYPFADEFIVQWEEALSLYPKAKYLGGGLY